MNVARNSMILSIIIIFLGGCASLSKQECVSGDWSAIGYNDGTRGMSPGRIVDHQKACAEYKIYPDVSAYEAGRIRGLEQVYCRASNAYSLGEGGRGYRNVCPSNMQANFLAAYSYGQDVRRLKSVVSEYQNRLGVLDSKLLGMDSEIAQLNGRIVQLDSARGMRKNMFIQHLRHELRNQKGKVDASLQRVSGDLHLSRKERNQLDVLVFVATTKGREEGMLAWLREYAQRGVNLHERKRRLRSVLRDINARLRKGAEMLRHSPKIERHFGRIDRLIQMAEYQGALESQVRILEGIEGGHRVKDLIQFHVVHSPRQHANHAAQHDRLLHFNRRAEKNALIARLNQIGLDRERMIRERGELGSLLLIQQRELDDKVRMNPYR